MTVILSAVMATRRVRIGIIGTGFMGRVHCEALRRLGTVDVATVAASSLEKAQAFAAAHGVPGAEGDYRAILADSSIDAVHICTPNARHFEMASAVIHAGKHVMCEKPLAMTSAEAASLCAAAAAKGVRHATCYNLRFYPMVQQMRSMREAGELGDILVAQGTYSQDWLLYDTDWNWRVEAKVSGPLRAMADIGSHWCDMLEHVSGERIAAVCADLATFHASRNRTAVNTEDYGGVLFHLGTRARGSFTVSQVAAGRKNRLSMEIYGTGASAAWSQERPDELWIGHRNGPNETLLKDPALLHPGAASYADLPGGHAEGYGDTFKQLFLRFYQSIRDSGSPSDYPRFDEGLRQMQLLDAVLASHRSRAWVDVPAG
jgi:predicted dehydrogenase